MAAEGTTIGAEVLRLLQLTVHTAFVHVNSTDVGHNGGRPKQVGADEDDAEGFVIDDGENRGELVTESEEDRDITD